MARQRLHLECSLIGLVCVCLLSGCRPSPPLQNASLRQPPAEPVIAVQAVRLRRGVLAQALSAPGSVVARRRSLIGVEVAGRILRVHATVGDRVTEGATLFEIDPTAYAMALRQAEAVLDVANADRHQVEADLRRAHTLRRQNVMAEQEIERLTTSLAMAQARLRQASEAAAVARQNLAKTVVRAPYAASVAERLADEGTMALVQPQTIVVILEETIELEARAAIAESQMGLVAVGDAATVRIQGLSEVLQTHVSAVADSIDPATRTYLVKMPVPNPQHRIKAGVFAHVEIQPQGSEMLLAPREAIRIEDGRTRLLVIDGERIDARLIEVGVVAENEAEIIAGADGSELVVVGDAARSVVTGMRVRAVDSDSPGT